MSVRACVGGTLRADLAALLSQGQGKEDSLVSTLPPCGAGGWYTREKERPRMDKVLPP